MGQSPDGMYLVETLTDVAHLSVTNPSRLSYVTQTTLSVDDADRIVSALKDRYPEITGPKRDDICYATQNRQDAAKALATEADVVLVVGSQSSSNSRRLREVAANSGAKAYLIDNAAQIDHSWLKDAKRVGVTAGASAPEILVTSAVSRLREEYAGAVINQPGIEENVTFALPKGLQNEL